YLNQVFEIERDARKYEVDILNGDITVNLDKRDGIEFKNLATSRMTCPDIATEQAFLLALESVDNAAKGSTPDTAVLKNAAGQTIISLKRLSAAEIADMDE
ncbi:MAG: META domain-containing protein, partial [Duncaniella sp.]|nr:META domain-containing protein [Duncaniella sp.]